MRNGKSESFTSLCKQLGQAIRGSATQNALLCYRAHQAYLNDHPETGHGKARTKAGSDRAPSFRVAAAKESGVCASTIDALLQVGKAIQSLSKTVQHVLVSSSLGNEVRVLRKLATSKFEKRRASMINAFVKQEKAHPKAAMKALKKKLGLRTSPKTPKKSNEPKAVSQPAISSGQSFKVAVDGQVFRVKGEIIDGQLRLTPVIEEKNTKSKPSLSATAIKSAKKTARLAA